MLQGSLTAVEDEVPWGSEGPLRSITDAVGKTPLVELARLSAGLPGRVVAKLESRNPTGSVKDRVAAALIDEAEQRGRLRPGGTIVAATSGNTGIALAHMGAARGYKVRLVIPAEWSQEQTALLLYLGTDIVRTDGYGMKAAVARAASLAAETEGAVLLDQFASPANPEIHRRTTAEEIWRGTRGEVAAFVAGVGTGGTITGVGLGLLAKNPAVKIVAVEPAGSPVLSGGVAGPHAIQGIGAGFIPPLLRFEVVGEIVTVTDDEAFDATYRLARQEGIVAGTSSGAAVFAALKLAGRSEMRGKIIVTLVCDSGERSVTTPRTKVIAPRRSKR